MLLRPGNNKFKFNFYFQHGWGFDNSCWQDWYKFIDGRANAFDRGYWGHPVNFIVEKSDDPVVFVSHSLGLHFLPEISLEYVDLLVIISGFHHFHGEKEQDGRFSRRHVERMHRRLATEPMALIQDFYKDCAYHHKPPLSAKRNTALLADDLLMLDTHVLDLGFRHETPNTLILHGQDDRIVPVKRGLQLSRNIPGSIFNCVPDAGHGLPFTHPQYCLELIAQSLNI